MTLTPRATPAPPRRSGPPCAREVLDWPNRSKLAHAFRWRYIYKRLKLAQLLGQLVLASSSHLCKSDRALYQASPFSFKCSRIYRTLILVGSKMAVRMAPSPAVPLVHLGRDQRDVIALERRHPVVVHEHPRAERRVVRHDLARGGGGGGRRRQPGRDWQQRNQDHCVDHCDSQ
jgi:hypothetical protein